MKGLLRTSTALALALALAAGPSGCGGPSHDEHRGRGTVLAVDPEARMITLDHGEIPGMMKAMTMTFDVASDVPLAGFEAGASVDFALEERGGRYTVTDLRPAAP